MAQVETSRLSSYSKPTPIPPGSENYGSENAYSHEMNHRHHWGGGIKSSHSFSSHNTATTAVSWTHHSNHTTGSYHGGGDWNAQQQQQRDSSSQHSRGSIWGHDDYSRSSHTSQGTFATSSSAVGGSGGTVASSQQYAFHRVAEYDRQPEMPRRRPSHDGGAAYYRNNNESLLLSSGGEGSGSGRLSTIYAAEAGFSQLSLHGGGHGEEGYHHPPELRHSSSDYSAGSYHQQQGGYYGQQHSSSLRELPPLQASSSQDSGGSYPAGTSLPGLTGATSFGETITTASSWTPQTSSLAAAAAVSGGTGVVPPPGFASGISLSGCTDDAAGLAEDLRPARDRNPRCGPRRGGRGGSNRPRNVNRRQQRGLKENENWSQNMSDMPVIEAPSQSQAIAALMKPADVPRQPSPFDDMLMGSSLRSLGTTGSAASSTLRSSASLSSDSQPILPQHAPLLRDLYAPQEPGAAGFGEDEEDVGSFPDDFDDDEDWDSSQAGQGMTGSKKKDWLLRMNKKLEEIPIGELDPATVPLTAIMNAWAKTKSATGAAQVELWLKRAQEEYDAGNRRIEPTTKMYTMAGT
jgi:hypothetical protein